MSKHAKTKPCHATSETQWNHKSQRPRAKKLPKLKTRKAKRKQKHAKAKKPLPPFLPSFLPSPLHWPASELYCLLLACIFLSCIFARVVWLLPILPVCRSLMQGVNSPIYTANIFRQTSWDWDLLLKTLDPFGRFRIKHQLRPNTLKKHPRYMHTAYISFPAAQHTNNLLAPCRSWHRKSVVCSWSNFEPASGHKMVRQLQALDVCIVRCTSIISGRVSNVSHLADPYDHWFRWFRLIASISIISSSRADRSAQFG